MGLQELRSLKPQLEVATVGERRCDAVRIEAVRMPKILKAIESILAEDGAIVVEQTERNPVGLIGDVAIMSIDIRD